MFQSGFNLVSPIFPVLTVKVPSTVFETFIFDVFSLSNSHKTDRERERERERTRENDFFNYSYVRSNDDEYERTATFFSSDNGMEYVDDV